MPDLKASCDPFEPMKNDLGAFEELPQVKVQLVAIEGMVLMEVGLVNGEEGRDCVEYCVHSFVSAGCA